jgi:hypothetical protein
MHTKKLNAIIFATSQILNLLIILYFAVLLAKLVWWVVNPSLSDVYIEKATANEFEKSAKYVINRYPFGVITKVVEPEHQAPPIASQVKLNGVYFNPPHSLAFITYSGKSHIVGVGDSIIENATLKSISTDKIVVSQHGADAIIDISPEASHSDSGSSYGADMPQGNHFGSGSRMGGQNTMPAVSHAGMDNSPPSNPSSPSNDEFRERRKKLIEEFAQKQPADTATNNANGNMNQNNNQEKENNNSLNNGGNNTVNSNNNVNNTVNPANAVNNSSNNSNATDNR